MSQVLDAFGLLDFTMLRPVLAWRAFLNLWTVCFFNFPNFFSGRGQPQITETANTVSADMAVCLYVVTVENRRPGQGKQIYLRIYRGKLKNVYVYYTFLLGL
jgi:hypothetical protein